MSLTRCAGPAVGDVAGVVARLLSGRPRRGRAPPQVDAAPELATAMVRSLDGGRLPVDADGEYLGDFDRVVVRRRAGRAARRLLTGLRLDLRARTRSGPRAGSGRGTRACSPASWSTIRPLSSRYQESHAVHAVPAKRACSARSEAASTSGLTASGAPRARSSSIAWRT